MTSAGVYISIGEKVVAVNNAAMSMDATPVADMCAWTERKAKAGRCGPSDRGVASVGICISRPGGVLSTSWVGRPSAVSGAVAVEETFPPNFTECREWSTGRPALTFSVEGPV